MVSTSYADHLRLPSCDTASASATHAHDDETVYLNLGTSTGAVVRPSRDVFLALIPDRPRSILLDSGGAGGVILTRTGSPSRTRDAAPFVRTTGRGGMRNMILTHTSQT